MDLTASMLRVAGASPPVNRKLDGIDILARVAARQPEISRTLFWRGRRADVTWKGVRDGDLKFVTRVNGTETTVAGLFDLSRDPGEATDLRSARPEDARRLADLLAAWEKEVAPTR
jgi:N-acetylgalactosamine-6-sulfatase